MALLELISAPLRLCRYFKLVCVSSCCICNGKNRENSGELVHESKPSSLGGVERLYKAAKLAIPELRRTEVKRFLQGKFAYSQHKQIRRKFTRRPVIATDKFDVFQMDLADMQKFSEHNDGFKYLLVVVDCFSKYACVVPLRSKTAAEVVRADFLKCLKNMAFAQRSSVTMGRSSRTRPFEPFERSAACGSGLAPMMKQRPRSQRN